MAKSEYQKCKRRGANNAGITYPQLDSAFEHYDTRRPVVASDLAINGIADTKIRTNRNKGSETQRNRLKGSFRDKLPCAF